MPGFLEVQVASDEIDLTWGWGEIMESDESVSSPRVTTRGWGMLEVPCSAEVKQKASKRSLCLSLAP